MEILFWIAMSVMCPIILIGGYVVLVWQQQHYSRFPIKFDCVMAGILVFCGLVPYFNVTLIVLFGVVFLLLSLFWLLDKINESDVVSNLNKKITELLSK